MEMEARIIGVGDGASSAATTQIGIRFLTKPRTPALLTPSTTIFFNLRGDFVSRIYYNRSCEEFRCRFIGKTI